MNHIEAQLRTNSISEPAERFFVMPMVGQSNPIGSANTNVSSSEFNPKASNPFAPPSPFAAPKPSMTAGKKKNDKVAESENSNDSEADQANSLMIGFLAGALGLPPGTHHFVEMAKIGLEAVESLENSATTDPKAALDPSKAFIPGKKIQSESDFMLSAYGSSSSSKEADLLDRLTSRRKQGPSSMSSLSSSLSTSISRRPGMR